MNRNIDVILASLEVLKRDAAKLRLKWMLPSLLGSETARRQASHFSEIHQKFKKIIIYFQKRETARPNTLTTLCTFSFTLPLNERDPFLEAAGSAHKLAVILDLIECCRQVSDTLPTHYKAAVEGGFLHECSARVLYEFQKTREGRSSELKSWAPGPYEGSLDVFENEMLCGDILVERFGFTEHDVRMTLGLYNVNRKELYNLAARAKLTISGPFAPRTRPARESV